MASVEEGLVAYLKAQGAIAALVGTRIYPIHLPQIATYPALAYMLISDDRPLTHSGATGLARPRFQIDCWAATYGAVKALERAVRAALLGFVGTMGTVSVRGVELDSAQDLFDEEAQKYRVRMDFFIPFREAA